MHFKTFGIILLSAGLALPAMAQTTASVAHQSPKEPTQPVSASASARAEALTANMSQALALTPAQTEKVRAINLASVRNVEAARQRYHENPAKLKSYIDDVSLARLDQLKDVLTSVQFARYQQKREEKMGIPTLRGNQGTPPPGLPSNRGEE
jgi:hypothetical protein